MKIPLKITAMLLMIVPLASCALLNPQAPLVLMPGSSPYPTSHITTRSTEMAALSTWMQTRGYKPSIFMGQKWQTPKDWEFQWFEKTHPSSTKVYIKLDITPSGELFVNMSCQSATQQEMKRITAGYKVLDQQIKAYYKTKFKL